MAILPPLDLTTALVTLCAFLALLCWLSTRRAPGLPPGPGPALPLLGHLHLMERDPRARFGQWRRQYGDVFSLYMGSRVLVVLCGYRVIKEALVKMADFFSHRPHIFVFDKIAKGQGIVSASGPTWKEQRKTSLEILRDLGLGKNTLALKIQEEVTHYIRAIEAHQGAPVDLRRTTQISVSNNVCSILMGKRFDYDDPDFCLYLSNLEKNFKLLAGTSIVNFIPILHYIPGNLFGMQQIWENEGQVRDFISKQMQKHRPAHMQEEEGEECADFIDAYRRQIRRQQLSGVTDTSVNESSLLRSIIDLYLAGTETTSTAISWALLFFLHYPHVQDTCYKEISDVVGTDRLPSMRDKPEMTYLEATICEVLRLADIVPMSVWHGLASDVTFRGYVIPKDAVIIPYLDSVLQDKDVWGDPEVFRPERFIGPDGKLTRPDEFIPFSVGRRVCLGESLARMELFLYLSSLIQRFRFLPAEPEKLPSLEGEMGLTFCPRPYKIRAVLRA